MNPPVPSDNCPAYPVSTFSPSAARERIRNGIMIVCSQYSLATAGMAMKATARMIAMPIRS